ncbi:MAG: SIS domain-containing protein [Candidatus Thermoplasmatota archaeon]|nr:SIS domain-containing protein [Candidatus Thermoplasmatota archaeon]MCL5665520.1 SIS domain-containing protein [Candidatus Thermoplasmatota archaeon]
MDYMDQYIEEGVRARKAISTGIVREFAGLMLERLSKNGLLITFGNGGSAADAQHFAAELNGHFLKERKAFPAIALSTNTSTLTAIGNDYSFDAVFERQVEAFVTKKDMVVGISTSGNSRNVVSAVRKARKIGALTFSMTGGNGGLLKDVSEKCFIAGSDKTPIIQETHITFIHMVCAEFDLLLEKSQKIEQ